MEKVWLKQYQSGVPTEIDRYVWRSLIEMFAKSAEQFADKPAFRNFSSPPQPSPRKRRKH